ncbi:MAG: GntR family transcriptional regulator [Acidobacteria bacterium]|nr:GntR family transcriptional regulator [Acidobacteriota bacterium]
MPQPDGEQDRAAGSKTIDGADAPPVGAGQRVYLGILQELEQHRLIPGRRLVETDLAARFGVGRNAVREAMQRLAMRGVVDLSPNKSASIRRLGLAQILDVLDVATEMTSLLARLAARAYEPDRHDALLGTAMEQLTASAHGVELTEFSRARRRFYRTLLMISGSEELGRIFPVISMHIIYSQFQSNRLLQVRLADYRAIYDNVRAKDAFAAAAAGRAHVEHVRDIVVSDRAAG